MGVTGTDRQCLAMVGITAEASRSGSQAIDCISML